MITATSSEPIDNVTSRTSPSRHLYARHSNASLVRRLPRRADYTPRLLPGNSRVPLFAVEIRLPSEWSDHDCKQSCTDGGLAMKDGRVYSHHSARHWKTVR